MRDELRKDQEEPLTCPEAVKAEMIKLGIPADHPLLGHIAPLSHVDAASENQTQQVNQLIKQFSETIQ